MEEKGCLSFEHVGQWQGLFRIRWIRNTDKRCCLQTNSYASNGCGGSPWKWTLNQWETLKIIRTDRPGETQSSRNVCDHARRLKSVSRPVFLYFAELLPKKYLFPSFEQLKWAGNSETCINDLTFYIVGGDRVRRGVKTKCFLGSHFVMRLYGENFHSLPVTMTPLLETRQVQTATLTR